MDAALQRMIESTTAAWTVERYKRLLHDLTVQQPELVVALVLHEDDTQTGTRKRRSDDGAAGSSRAKRTSDANGAGVSRTPPSTPKVDTKRFPPLAPISPSSYSTELKDHLAELDAISSFASDRKNRLRIVIVLAHQFDWADKTIRAFFDYAHAYQHNVVLPPGTTFTPMPTESSVRWVIRSAKDEFPEQSERWLRVIPAPKPQREPTPEAITFHDLEITDWPLDDLAPRDQARLVLTRGENYRRGLVLVLSQCGFLDEGHSFQDASTIEKDDTIIVIPATIMNGLMTVARIGLNLIAARPREVLKSILKHYVFKSIQVSALVLVRELQDVESATIKRMFQDDAYTDLISDLVCIRARGERSVDVAVLSQAIETLEQVSR